MLYVNATTTEAATAAMTRLRGLEVFGEQGLAELERRRSGGKVKKSLIRRILGL